MKFTIWAYAFLFFALSASFTANAQQTKSEIKEVQAQLVICPFKVSSGCPNNRLLIEGKEYMFEADQDSDPKSLTAALNKVVSENRSRYSIVRSKFFTLRGYFQNKTFFMPIEGTFSVFQIINHTDIQF